jgi:hypothetical protein
VLAVSGMGWGSAAPAVREAVQEGRSHFGVAKDTRPFAESEIGGDDDGSALVEPADQMKEELTAGLREGRVAETRRARRSLCA